MRRPNKPHVDGFEDEEDCEGYFDQWEVDRRRCPVFTYRQSSDLDPCKKCIMDGHAREEARQKADWEAKTPEERAYLEALTKGLRELY